MQRKGSPPARDGSDRRRAILRRLAACDTSTLRRLAALLEPAQSNPAAPEPGYLDQLHLVTESDISGLEKSERSYGNSWKRRGGVDTYHMLTRKWDRLERHVAGGVDAGGGARSVTPYDIFEHIAADRRADGIIDDVRDLRRYLMLVEAEAAARSAGRVADSGRGYLDHLRSVAQCDVSKIREKEKVYASSWKRRGGVAVFMMLARKWDRIEQRVTTRVDPEGGAPGATRDNILEHIAADRRSEGVMEDIRDLRRFLVLVEAEMAARGVVEVGTARDNRERT